jgi:RimJ/RimL family protein N-acetyltransferase
MENDLIITTRRLQLRLLQPSDIDNLLALNSDPEVRRFFPDGVQDRTQTEARIKDFLAFYQYHGLPCFVMFELASGEFVGRGGFGPIAGEIEVGYLLHKKYWGQGYATEALAALLHWAHHNIQAEHIIAITPTEHLVSQRVVQKCAMIKYKTDTAYGVRCDFYRIKNR